MITLSIITPVYNGAGFIAACLENVIAQDCAVCEHIIVDGGSQDGTVEIVQDYAARYSHIRWISKPDSGQSEAMNRGVELARGQVLGFLNVDDAYQPGVLNQVARRFSGKSSPHLLVGNCNIWNDQSGLLQVNRPRRMHYLDLLVGPAVFPYPYNPSAYFYHAALHTLTGKFDLEDHYSMDLGFILRAAQAAWRGQAVIEYIDQTWGNFYLHGAAKTYRDMLAGKTSERQRQLLRIHRQALPPLPRVWVTLRYWLFGEILVSLKYFARHPGELPGRLTRRISGLRNTRTGNL